MTPETEGLRKAARKVFWEAAKIEKAQTQAELAVLRECLELLSRVMANGWCGQEEPSASYLDGHAKGLLEARDHIKFLYWDRTGEIWEPSE